MSNSAYYNGVPYSGHVTIQTLPNGTYTWKVDNKRFTFSDYSSIDETDIANPYYREGIINAVSANTATILPVPNTPVVPNTYRIWNFVPPDQIPSGNRLSTPYAVNYKGIDLTRRLHPKTWKVHGLVVQVIYYENYNPATDEYSVPVVRERWNWDLDPGTNFANSRTIVIEWYGSNDDTSDPENPVPVILPPAKSYLKYYTTTADRVTEIQRRRENVIRKLEEDIIGLIATTETAGNVLEAIVLGQAFVTDINLLESDFINHGDDDLANAIIGEDIRSSHTWLDNDCTSIGMPGVLIHQIIYNELTMDISDAIDTFTFDSISEY